MKKFILILLFVLICNTAHADVFSSVRGLIFSEEDGDPIGVPRTLKVTDGSLTDNLDGTFSLSAGGSQTLQDVTDNGATTTNEITAAGFNVTRVNGYAQYLNLYEDPVNDPATNNNYFRIYTPATLAGNVTWTLPTAASGGANYLVNVDADGTMGYTDPASFVTPTSTQTLDFGGATLEIPNATDPDLTVTGQVSMDTDGANESGDVSIRGFDGTNQFLVDRKLKTIQATIMKPQDLADTERDLCPIWHNNTGMVFTITEINAWSDTDNTTVGVEVVTASDWSAPASVDALEIATDGTSVFTCTETTITDATIAHDEIITLDFDDTDDPGVVKVTITGWFSSDID